MAIKVYRLGLPGGSGHSLPASAQASSECNLVLDGSYERSLEGSDL